MLLRITYSNTKSFLKSSIHTFKSYFAGGYQRLPKTPPCNPFSCTTSRGAAGTHATRFNTRHHNQPPCKEPTNTTNEPNSINNQCEIVEIKKQENKRTNCVEKDEELSKCLVTTKLNELKMMDRNNVDLVLDIEEALHYFSRLTCPLYRDIIEKFFVEVYSGTFVLSRVENLGSKMY